MRFEHRARVPASLDKLWDFLMDVKAVGTCIPGVEEVREIDADNYIGVQKIKVGPIALRFEGKMTITDRDKEAGRATMKVVGADRGAGGTVNATIIMSITGLGPNESDLTVVTNADVMGKLGEFGQPVIRKKADAMMSEFTQNLGRRMTSSDL